MVGRTEEELLVLMKEAQCISLKVESLRVVAVGTTIKVPYLCHFGTLRGAGFTR